MHLIYLSNLICVSVCLPLCLGMLSCVQLFVTPWTVARQAPLSMGFSRPEYWSGLPFPPPRDLPDPGIKPRSPTLQADSLPAKPQGKPKNTGVGSLSLLHGIFLSQALNWGLLHCRRILYQLNFLGSPSTFYLPIVSAYHLFYYLSVCLPLRCIYLSSTYLPTYLSSNTYISHLWDPRRP